MARVTARTSEESALLWNVEVGSVTTVGRDTAFVLCSRIFFRGLCPRALGCITEHWSSRPGRPSASSEKSMYAHSYVAGPQLSGDVGRTPP